MIDGEGAYLGPTRRGFVRSPLTLTSSTNKLGVYFYLGSIGNRVNFDYAMIGEGTGLAGTLSETFVLPRLETMPSATMFTAIVAAAVMMFLGILI